MILFTLFYLLVSVAVFSKLLSYLFDFEEHKKLYGRLILYFFLLLVFDNINVTISYLELTLFFGSLIISAYLESPSVLSSESRKSHSEELVFVWFFPVLMFGLSFDPKAGIILPIYVFVTSVLTCKNTLVDKFIKGKGHPFIVSGLTFLMLTSPMIAYSVYIQNNYSFATARNVGSVYLPCLNSSFVGTQYGDVLMLSVSNGTHTITYVWYNNMLYRVKNDKLDWLKVKIKHPFTRVVFTGYMVINGSIVKMYRVGNSFVEEKVHISSEISCHSSPEIFLKSKTK